MFVGLGERDLRFVAWEMGVKRSIRHINSGEKSTAFIDRLYCKHSV